MSVHEELIDTARILHFAATKEYATDDHAVVYAPRACSGGPPAENHNLPGWEENKDRHVYWLEHHASWPRERYQALQANRQEPRILWSATRSLSKVTCPACIKSWEYIEACVEKDTKGGIK